MKELKLSPILEKETSFVVKELGPLPSICSRCKAKLDSYADRCNADLSECCPGYLLIENTKVRFYQQRKRQTKHPNLLQGYS